MEFLSSEGSDEAADPDPAGTTLAGSGRGDRAPLPGRRLYVPVRVGSAGGTQVQFARTPTGRRTAVAFTSRRRLAAAFGDQQSWVVLAEPALRSLAEPLGAALVTVDPSTAVTPRATTTPVLAPSVARPGCSRRIVAPAGSVPGRDTGAEPAGTRRTLSLVGPA